MTVNELIEQLQKVSNKDIEVFMYYSGNNNLNKTGSLAYIDHIDDEIGTRVEIACVD